MQDLEEALTELSAAVAAQSIAIGEMLELLTAHGAVDRVAFLARLRERAESADLSDLQRISLSSLIDIFKKPNDSELRPLFFNGEAAEVISLDEARQRANRPSLSDTDLV